MLLHLINPLTAAQFSVDFKDVMLFALDNSNALSADELGTLFNSTCTNILNNVAQFKTVRPKPFSKPAERRQAERKWKKDMLHVSLAFLRNCLSRYQKAVKLAKTKSLVIV